MNLHVAILVIVAIAAVAWFLGRAQTQSRRAPRVTPVNTAVTLLLGLGFLAYGLFSVVEAHRSPHVTVTGKIANLTEYYSRGGAHSNFNVVRSDGVPFFLRAHYNGPELQNGNMVTAEFLDWNYEVTNLTALSGPYAGWHHSEDGGVENSYLVLGIGALMLIMAVRRRSQAKAASDKPSLR
jgi:hypothetical protein